MTEMSKNSTAERKEDMSFVRSNKPKRKVNEEEELKEEFDDKLNFEDPYEDEYHSDDQKLKD